MDLLSDAERQQFSTTHSDWTIDRDVMRREFVLANFGEAIGFVVQVSLLAEKANHHPDIDIRWNRVTLALTSHDAGGLTDRDVSLAEKIEALADGA